MQTIAVYVERSCNSWPEKSQANTGFPRLHKGYRLCIIYIKH
jgi:hypothetical protein